ncbi:hypothetical protein KSP40_PGU014694 [Platanthera guangdongensis]|uniref:Kinesin motor domain-containing protein n=1 Tax=Platanthera guangdongensis TaxID=2320717 RepID=A0ABR2MMJ6_9ASPA
MVFGLCLRSLLEHQRNPKKPVEKHFKNSLLTRYLQDYMEGKKRMTLILTVKAAEEDYMETSSILRQASPYMKIKFNHLDENKNAPCKRRSAIVIRTERSKKRKVNNSEASLTDMNHVMMDAAPTSQISERDSAGEDCIEKHYTADFNVELQKIKSSEEVMRDFARAVWSMLKQCKHKLMETENEVRFLRDSLREQITQTTELEKELKELRNSCSCLHNATVGEYSKVLPFSHAVSIPLISSNPDLSHGNDALLDEYCEMCLDENSESCNKVTESGMLVGGMNHLVEDLLSTPSLTVALEGEHCISLFPENKDASIMQEEKKPENESLFLKAYLREHSTQATELEKVSKESTISSSCLHNPPVEECDIAPSVNHALFVPAISLNPNLSQNNDALPDEYRTPMEEVSCATCSIFPLEEAKELNYQYSDENSERCQKVEHSEMPVGRMDAVVMNVSKVPSLTVELGGEGCFSLLPGNEETSVMQVEKSAETSGVTEMDPCATTLDMSLFNTRSTVLGDMGKLSLPVHEGVLQQEEVSCATCSIFPLEEAKELNYQYSDENSERCQKLNIVRCQWEGWMMRS